MLQKLRPSKPRWWLALERDIKVFVYLFPWQITFVLLLGLLLTSYLFWLAHLRWQGESISPLKAIFAVINMTFFQLTFADMPTDSRLDIFPVIVPLVGLPLFSIFGIRVINVIRVFFLRKERGQEWQEALVQSAIDNHVVVCGVGRIGYRVARSLVFDYRQVVVGINDTETNLVTNLLSHDIPVIVGSVEQEEVLKKAGIAWARVVVICTNHDWINLETLVRVRRLNRRARIVLRLFEDELVEDLKANFGIEAVISRSAVAALSLAYAAVGGKILETFRLNQKKYVLAQLPVTPHSPMLGCTVGQFSETKDVTVVCHNRGATLTVEPPASTRLEAGDHLFLFTLVEQMMSIVEHGLDHPAAPQATTGTILVCGLGHTGYRIATNLAALGRRVVALDFEPNRLAPRLKEMGIPLIFGDLRWDSLLLDAGISQASAIVACTDDDMANLQITLRARSLKPDIRVVMRIFDDGLSEHLRQTFGLQAIYSTSALASPDFVSAALNRMNARLVDIEGVPQMIVRLRIHLSALYDLPLVELNEEAGLTVLLHAQGDQVDIPPRANARLKVDDEIVVLTTEEKLAELNHRNKSAHELLREGYL